MQQYRYVSAYQTTLLCSTSALCSSVLFNFSAHSSVPLLCFSAHSVSVFRTSSQLFLLNIYIYISSSEFISLSGSSKKHTQTITESVQLQHRQTVTEMVQLQHPQTVTEMVQLQKPLYTSLLFKSSLPAVTKWFAFQVHHTC